MDKVGKKNYRQASSSKIIKKYEMARHGVQFRSHNTGVGSEKYIEIVRRSRFKEENSCKKNRRKIEGKKGIFDREMKMKKESVYRKERR